MADGRMNRRIAGLLAARLPELQLEEAADPRKRRGRRWPQLATLLRTVVCAMVAGCKNLAGAEALTAEMAPGIRRLLGIRRRVPDTTLRSTVVRLAPTSVVTRLHAQMGAAFRRKALRPKDVPFGVAALDGKVSRKMPWPCDADGIPVATDPYAQRVQPQDGDPYGLVRTTTVSLVSTEARPCIHVSPIPPKTNEMGHFRQVVRELVAAYGSRGLFKMLTYDAGACSEANGAFVVSQKLHYVFTLKEDQPTLLAEARRVLARRPDEQADAVTEDVDGPTVITRRVFVSSEMAGYMWSHLKTVLRVVSETRRIDTGVVVRRAQRYFVSSYDAKALEAVHWARIVRMHWGVENPVHRMLDTAFKEDDHPWIESGLTASRGMVVLFILRRIAYNLVALYRTVTQRSEDRRKTPWANVMRWIYNTLIGATEAQLRALRPRKAVLAGI